MGRPGLTRHPKFARLSRLLGSEALARGHLELLWEVAYENGDDSLGDAGDVEYLAKWQGDAGKLAGMLVEAGFLDLEEETYRVHDLLDHAPRYVQQRAEREAKRKQNGETLRLLRSKAGAKGGIASGRARKEREANEKQAAPFAAENEANGHPPAPAPAPAQETFPATDVAVPPAKLNGQKPRGQKPRNPALEALKDAMVKAHGETQNEGLSWPGSAWGELQEIRATLADDEEVLRRWKLFLVDRYWPIKNVHKFQVAYQHPKFKPPPVSAAGPKPQAIPVFR
jgi:hypothetical protein